MSNNTKVKINNKGEYKSILKTYDRLEEQINWYDKKSMINQKLYKRTEILKLIGMASIPIVGILNVDEPFIYLLSIGVLFIQTLQHMNRWQYLWNSYRSNCEALRHEKSSYEGNFGVYGNLNEYESLNLLMRRVECLISVENSKWIDSYDTNRNKVKDK